MSLPAERQAAIRATLEPIHDPHERLSVAIHWNNQMRELQPAERCDLNLVAGCISKVWLAAEIEEGKCRFRVDAESVLVRGLAAILCSIYDGARPKEVINEEPVVLEELGILRNLSPTRQNGLAALRRALVEFARNGARSGNC